MKVLLSEITTKIGSGMTPKGGDASYKEEGISLIRSQNVIDLSFNYKNLAKIDETQAGKLSNVIVENNDILINITGDSIARVSKAPNDALPARVNQHVSIIRLKDNISPSYVLYYLYNLKKYLLSICGVGGTRNALTKDALENLYIDLPTSLKEQELQVKILDTILKKIELNNKVNAELEAMAKTLYEYWFVQFDFPDENGNPYKSSGGKMVYNSKLKRKIPQGWEVKLVKDFCEVITGKEDANFSTINGKYDFFTCGESILKCDTSAFSGKAVLIAGNGNFNVKYFEGNFNAYQRTYILIPNDEIYIGIMYMSSKNSIARFTKGSNGSIVKFITKGDVENISIFKPNNTNFFTKINVILSKIHKNTKENQTLAELRDWLLPMLMNGQVKVNAKEDVEVESLELVLEQDKRLASILLDAYIEDSSKTLGYDDISMYSAMIANLANLKCFLSEKSLKDLKKAKLKSSKTVGNTERVSNYLLKKGVIENISLIQNNANFKANEDLLLKERSLFKEDTRTIYPLLKEIRESYNAYKNSKNKTVSKEISLGIAFLDNIFQKAV